MISGRVWNNQGDFGEMGDDAIPDYINDEPWESPASIFADTWGYRSWQKRTGLVEKIHEHILRLVKVTSRGGNYILNIGPPGTGAVVDYEEQVLRGVGQWLKENGEAIYASDPQPFRDLDFGYATVKGDHLFLFVENQPTDGKLRLPGLRNHLVEAHWLNSNRSLAVSDGSISIYSVPAGKFLPVIAARFEGKLEVVPRAIQPGADDIIHLTSTSADRFYNENGEGYYDSPTLRREQWHFAVKRAGRYKVTITYKPGRFARLLDVQIGNQIVRANLYGTDKQAVVSDGIALAASEDVLLSLAPAAPRERGAKIDFEIDQVSVAPK